MLRVWSSLLCPYEDVVRLTGESQRFCGAFWTGLKASNWLRWAQIFTYMLSLPPPPPHRSNFAAEWGIDALLSWEWLLNLSCSFIPPPWSTESYFLKAAWGSIQLPRIPNRCSEMSADYLACLLPSSGMLSKDVKPSSPSCCLLAKIVISNIWLYSSPDEFKGNKRQQLRCRI